MINDTTRDNLGQPGTTEDNQGQPRTTKDNQGQPTLKPTFRRSTHFFGHI